jgi:hypothetical protein
MKGCGRKIGHLKIIPLTLAQANILIAKWHRHHKPVLGHRFSIGAVADGEVVGAAVVGRPVARECDPYYTVEVTRLVTNGHRNACSFLYSACARIAREMGFQKIQTYILNDEPGTSLRAAGWSLQAVTRGGNWNHSWRKGRREDQPMLPKQRWSKKLNAEERWIPLIELEPKLFESDDEQLSLELNRRAAERPKGSTAMSGNAIPPHEPARQMEG